jgi:hypothetical protein
VLLQVLQVPLKIQKEHGGREGRSYVDASIHLCILYGKHVYMEAVVKHPHIPGQEGKSAE